MSRGCLAGVDRLGLVYPISGFRYMLRIMPVHVVGTFLFSVISLSFLCCINFFQAMRITEARIVLKRTANGYLLQLRLRQLRVWQLSWHRASEANAHPSPK